VEGKQVVRSEKDGEVRSNEGGEQRTQETPHLDSFRAVEGLVVVDALAWSTARRRRT